MKIRSLLLGSAAVAGLSTGAYAADLGVLTSLDVCDSLGLSGLTVSSDTNCLQINGEVKYRFSWGDWKEVTGDIYVTTPYGTNNYDDENGASDWETRFDAYFRVVASAKTDFGPAKAVIKLKQIKSVYFTGYPEGTSSFASGINTSTYIATVSGSSVVAVSESSFASGTASYAAYGSSANSASDTASVIMDEAYVAIGDSTVIMAGKKGSIFKDGDDEPLNYLGLFNSQRVGTGVWATRYDPDDTSRDFIRKGGHVLQVTTDLGNGFALAAGLESLDSTVHSDAGTLVGVLSYAGDGISAHASFMADGVLAGEIQDWAAHLGFSGKFDNFRVVLAGAFDSEEYYNVLASASATFDMFTIAGSIEAAGDNPNSSTVGDYWGAGASISAKVTDTVTVNLGGRWAQQESGVEAYEVALGVVAAVTDTLKLTGQVGFVDDDSAADSVFFGSAKVDWAPGGGLTSSLMGRINSDGGYKVETIFTKAFQ